VNSGRIFTENILPLFTEIEKSNCFSIYTGSDLNNIFRRKPLKIDLIDLFTDTAAILDSFVSDIYYGMLRGQIHTNLPPEHPIITI